ncbi:hypothetical protein Tco_0887118 [Tanacetum coccineum]
MTFSVSQDIRRSFMAFHSMSQCIAVRTRQGPNTLVWGILGGAEGGGGSGGVEERVRESDLGDWVDRLTSTYPLKKSRPEIKFVLSDCVTKERLKVILNPLLKALGADLYALTMSVDAKDQANGTNDEEYTYFLGMNQELERHLREKDASRTEKLTEQKVVLGLPRCMPAGLWSWCEVRADKVEWISKNSTS